MSELFPLFRADLDPVLRTGVSRGWFARLTGRIGCHAEALSPEFRRRALDLVAGGRTVVEVAELLGIAESCLYRWKGRDLVDRGLKIGQNQRGIGGAGRRAGADPGPGGRGQDPAQGSSSGGAGGAPKDRFGLVADLHHDSVRVGHACNVRGVSRSGYYEWASRAPSTRGIRHVWLTDLIGAIHATSNRTYGQLRVHAELVHGNGVAVGHHTVQQLMSRVSLPRRHAALPRHRR
jgi:putative transposase